MPAVCSGGHEACTSRGKSLMKSLRLLFCVIWLSLVAACVTGEADVVVGVETAVNVTPRATTPLPTHTPIPPTSPPTLTSTPEPSPTATPVSATNTPIPTATLVPQPTPTATPILKPPVGRLYFLWDSQPLNQDNVRDASYQLFLARSLENSGEWYIEPMLNDLIGFPDTALSPDQTKLALTYIIDFNGDGHASQESVNRGFDGYLLGVYDLVSQHFTPLNPSQANPYNLDWLADNETIIFRVSQDILTHHISNQPSQKLIPSPSDRTQFLSVSANKQVAMLRLTSGQNLFIDTSTGEIIFTTEGLEQVAWSPNNQWLATVKSETKEVMLLNAQTFETLPLQTLNSVEWLAWSPDSQTLAVIQSNDVQATLQFLTVADFAFQEILTVQGKMNRLNRSIDPQFGFSWAPDSSQLALAVQQEGVISLTLIDQQTKASHPIWQSGDHKRLHKFTWSPDSQWLAFIAGQAAFYHYEEEEAGLYVIHKSGGGLQQVQGTATSADPWVVFWLP